MCLAVPGEILNISGEGLSRMAKVSFGGIVKEINLAYVPEADTGDYVIVHAGFALNMIDEAEAQQLLKDIEEIDKLSS